MAHFAQLDGNNVVTQVIVIHNNELMDNGVESEQKGIDFCKSIYGADTLWVQTSYNGTKRKNFAGPGYTYDPQRDAFIPPKPHASWLFNEEKCQWYPPFEEPKDGKVYYWDEDILNWVAR